MRCRYPFEQQILSTIHRSSGTGQNYWSIESIFEIRADPLVVIPTQDDDSLTLIRYSTAENHCDDPGPVQIHLLSLRLTIPELYLFSETTNHLTPDPDITVKYTIDHL